jgi:hypothetical protein
MNKKLFSILVILAFIFALSCEKDEEPTVEENMATLDELATLVESDMDMVFDGEALDAFMTIGDLMEIDDTPGFSFKKSKGTSICFSNFYKLGVMRSDDEPFVFQEHVGTYTWNAEYQGWVIQQNNPNDKIIIIFPSQGHLSSDNDVTLTFYDFQEVKITEVDQIWYEPSEIDADLYKNDTLLIDLDFSATWDQSNGNPTSMDIELFIKPFTLSGGFAIQGTAVSINASLDRDEEKIVSGDLTLTFKTNSLEDIAKIEGYLQYRPIKVEGEIDIAAIEELEDPTIEQLNEYVDLAIYNYPGGSKIADIELYLDENKEIDIRLVFTDETTVPASDYFDDILQAVEDRIEEFDGGDG